MTHKVVIFNAKISDLEEENEELKKEVNKLRALNETTAKRNNERRQTRSKEHNEEIKLLEKSNKQLKVMFLFNNKNNNLLDSEQIAAVVSCLKIFHICSPIQKQLEEIIHTVHV